MNKRVAVIMSGHARMVPWGMAMLKDRFSWMSTPVDWDIFSYTWTNDSESQRLRPQGEMDRFLESQQILIDLKTRHQVHDQSLQFDPLYQRFLDAGAIPTHSADQRGFSLDRSSFNRFLGQVIGFCRAVDTWRKELQDYDYIVRSRWDMTLDASVLEILLKNERRSGHRSLFYTKSVEIMQGHVEISGDTIYGETEQWLEAFSSTEQCITNIIAGSRRRWQQLQKQWRPEWSKDPELEKYYLKGWWFNSHFIWTTLFLNHSISLNRLGDSFGIDPVFAKIPPDEFEFNYCKLGIDWRTKAPRPITEFRVEEPHLCIPEPNNKEVIDQLRSQHEEYQEIHRRQHLKRQQLEQQIKGQTPH